MTIKDKVLLVFLGIITLGIYPAVVFLKKPVEGNKELVVSNKITVDVSKLHQRIGGAENVSGIEFTHTKVKIFIKDSTKVNVDQVKELKGISGVFATSKYLTIIVGNQAANLSKEI